MSQTCNYSIYFGNSLKASGSISGQVTVSDLLRTSGITLNTPCAGKGRCGKCRVAVSGEFLPPDAAELALLGEDYEKGERLACRAVPCGDFVVRVHEDGAAVIRTEGYCAPYRFNPEIALRENGGEWQVLRNGIEIDVRSQRPRILGLAVDIGTTTVAVYLCDLENGKTLGVRGELNAQRNFGADVISRITASSEGHLNDLCAAIRGQISEMAHDLCEKSGLGTDNIYAVAVCGNPTMEHLFFGYDPAGIAVAPFTPVSLFGTAHREIPGLLLPGYCEVYILPSVSAYVGGDITSGVLACGIDSDTKITLLLDVGTNGETALGCGGDIYYCSTAAGPAFEGAHISDGVGGITGAISSVKLEDGEIVFKTIGGAAPVGICGSGIIDAAAVMLECGAIDDTGRLVDPDELDEKYRPRLDDDARKFIIDPVSGIGLTDKDIRQIQLAKAAIAAGIDTLVHYADIGGKMSLERIDRVCLAGGFGAHLNSDSACAIGLIPPALRNKIITVGNSAGAGSVRTLLDAAAKPALASLKNGAHYIELSCDAFFNDRYVENMYFEN